MSGGVLEIPAFVIAVAGIFTDTDLSYGFNGRFRWDVSTRSGTRRNTIGCLVQDAIGVKKWSRAKLKMAYWAAF